MILPERLLYVELEVEKERLEDVVVRLGRWGFFHPEISKENGVFIFEDELILSQLQSVAEFLKIPPTPSYQKVNVEALKDKFERLYRETLKLKEELAQVEKEKELLRLAEKVDESFGGNVSKLVRDLRVIPFRAGTIKKEVSESLSLSLQSEKLYALFASLYHGDLAVLIFFPPEREYLFEKIQSAFNVTPVPLKYFKEEVKKEIESREELIKRKIEEIKRQHEKDVASALGFLRVKKRIFEVTSSGFERDGKKVLKGWIPEKKKEEFLKLFNDCRIKFHPPGENPPSLIQTPSFLKPIEEIVFSYSYPSYHDVNPVLPFIAVFVLLFGVMFGDVGHGLMLSALAVLLEKKGKKAIGRLMLLSGISSTIFGFLYGSAFGREVFHPLLFSPMKSVESLLVFSIGIGVIVITAGFIIKFFSSVHRESFEQVIFGEEGVLSFVAYWLSLGILIKALVLKMSVKVELTILFILLLASFLYAFRKTKQAATSFIDAVRILLENLINTLSFMRLGAFALAHGALFFAVFTVAESVRALKGGTLIYWLIVVLGNLFVVALEGLIVTIQALRLNYYEFFKKFYRGGGRPFKPFRLEVE
ncbi:V/A-type H+-transporting ATPase subunit I [Desulfurobacterium pacificum]|uniref:V/A-type H+-transporting ATPase subunit I n=1 Tax=Desulfurobacterium pacificum TaxID=240166 RepID=A0ABY1NE97_9BACT|nr:V-type ATPase 116kDa subunit family protein [Desulfurobacterium pacificum]SMP07579.1 V/A-type H+-transporting ATPase subunit I [Desulfurobacterium pacificum]